MIDHRKLLKDCIRGMVWDHDVPAMPGPIDEHGEQTKSTREELALFFELVAEVIAEGGSEPRKSVIRELVRLQEEYFAEPGS